MKFWVSRVKIRKIRLKIVSFDPSTWAFLLNKVVKNEKRKFKVVDGQFLGYQKLGINYLQNSRLHKLHWLHFIFQGPSFNLKINKFKILEPREHLISDHDFSFIPAGVGAKTNVTNFCVMWLGSVSVIVSDVRFNSHFGSYSHLDLHFAANVTFVWQQYFIPNSSLTHYYLLRLHTFAGLCRSFIQVKALSFWTSLLFQRSKR